VRPRAELIRLVRDGDGQVSVDREGVAEGRGAYACAVAECLQKAFQPGRLGHTFKRASRAPRESVLVILEGWLESRKRRR
jgi:predicted RNA-binding protein YlxR (DUF448 family)